MNGGELPCGLSGSVCIFAGRVPMAFFTDVGNALVVSFNVICRSIYRSISDMVVPFNLYSLGYFLKQFTEHYLN